MPRLRNVTTGKVLARNVMRADGIVTRILGFIPRSEILPDDGLWIENCSAIHTIGMRARIDVVFLDKGNRVLRVARSVRGFCPMITCIGAQTVVELGEASASGRDLLTGDQLVLE